MSSKTTMETRKKGTQAIIPSRSFMPQRRTALPQHVDDVPASGGRSLHDTLTKPGLGHDFSRIRVHSDARAVEPRQSCPLASASPRFCPFGGACHTCPPRVQAKRATGQPGDQYEQEADIAVEQVMRMPALQTPVGAADSGRAQPATVPPIVHEVLCSPGQPLDSATRAYVEPRFGRDFSQVRVHTDAKAAGSARAANALAYTVGRDVVFGTGKYAPMTHEGRRLMAHELTHVVQQVNQSSLQSKLEIGGADNPFEREADSVATSVLNSQPFTQNLLHRQAQQLQPGIIQRAAIHTGNILDEGSCEHLACNSKYACEDNENGITCPEGTRNASKTKKFRPLFTCDNKCENNKTCSDSDKWMAIPNKRFARSKCNQDLVICANGKFTHASVRDKSDRQAWEVSHGIQDKLGVSPYAKFTGAIYGDESDPDFKKDTRCHGKVSSEKSETSTVAPSFGEVESEETPVIPTSTAGEEKTVEE